MSAAVLITGAAGGIGAALVHAFSGAGWTVVATDRKEPTAPSLARFIKANLAEFCDDERKCAAFAGKVREALGDAPLAALVNNAAAQILGGVEELTAPEFLLSMKVNVVAPFVLVKTFLSDLEAAKGAVVNIGSVHAAATKPEFSAYAASKAALHGLTRALAVDLGPKVRVVALAPAATATEMLKAGFEGKASAFAALEDVHPLKRIASPEEIAKIALFLVSKDAAFMTGSVVYADGGILSRLHDPA